MSVTLAPAACPARSAITSKCARPPESRSLPWMSSRTRLARASRACGPFDFSVLQTALRDEAGDPDDEHHEAREGRHEF